MTINVLIVDDDPTVRNQFDLKIRQTLNEVNSRRSLNVSLSIDHAESYNDALSFIATKRASEFYDIAIVDNILSRSMDLGGGCGAIIVEKIIEKNRSAEIDCKILFCSAEIDFNLQNDALGTIMTDEILDIPLELKNGPRFKLRIARLVYNACLKYV